MAQRERTGADRAVALCPGTRPPQPGRRSIVFAAVREGRTAGHQHGVERPPGVGKAMVGGDQHPVRRPQWRDGLGNQRAAIAVARRQEAVRLGEDVERPGHVEGLDTIMDDQGDTPLRNLRSSCCMAVTSGRICRQLGRESMLAIVAATGSGCR